MWKGIIEITQQPIFPSVLNIINIFLIFITALVAYLSWRTSKKANELQLLPLLAIYFKGRVLTDRTIRIRNIGKTPAYDIKMDGFTLIFTDTQKVWKLDLLMKGTNVLVPEEERDLIQKSTATGDVDFMVFHLDPEEEHKRKRTGLTLNFRDAEGKKYFSEIETGVGGLFIKPAKKIGFFNFHNRLRFFYKTHNTSWILKWYRFLWRFRKPYVKQSK